MKTHTRSLIRFLSLAFLAGASAISAAELEAVPIDTAPVAMAGWPSQAICFVVTKPGQLLAIEDGNTTVVEARLQESRARVQNVRFAFCRHRFVTAVGERDGKASHGLLSR